MSIYSNVPIRIDRKSTGESSRLDSPFVNILGNTQNHNFHELFKDGRLYDGFFSRFLFTLSEKRPARVIREEMQIEIEKEYQDYVMEFLQKISFFNIVNFAEPVKVDCSLQALEKYYSWEENVVIPILNQSNTDEITISYIQKLKTCAFRIALIFQFLEEKSDNSDLELAKPAMDKAIRICNYFYSTFLRVKDLLDDSGIFLNKENIQIQHKFTKLIISGLNRNEALQTLKNSNISLGQLARTFNVHKSNIHYWVNQG